MNKIKSTGNGKRFPRRSMAKLLPVNGWEHHCRGSDSNVELNDTRSNETSSLCGLAKRRLHCILKQRLETNPLYLRLAKQLDPLPLHLYPWKTTIPTPHRHHSRLEMNSMPKRSTRHQPSSLLGLPQDLCIEIAVRVGATSERPFADLCSLHGTCSTMRRVCGHGNVGRRFSIEGIWDEISWVWNPTGLGIQRLASSPESKPSWSNIGDTMGGHDAAAYLYVILL
jgi:hypothetical protein